MWRINIFLKNRFDTRSKYRKIPKISPGAQYIFQRPFLRDLYSEGLIYGGKFAFQIDWASLIAGSKFTVFALFYFVFEGNFPSTSPRGAYIWRGNLTEGFLRYRFGGPIFGGAFTWRGLFSEFYGISETLSQTWAKLRRTSGVKEKNSPRCF